jgi:hypothetical protein
MDRMLKYNTRMFYNIILKKKVEVIPVTRCGGPQGCETSRPPHFLKNWLTDGSEVVSLMYQPPFNARRLTVFKLTLKVLHPVCAY